MMRGGKGTVFLKAAPYKFRLLRQEEHDKHVKAQTLKPFSDY